jgi:hypothetical protein
VPKTHRRLDELQAREEKAEAAADDAERETGR